MATEAEPKPAEHPEDVRAEPAASQAGTRTGVREGLDFGALRQVPMTLHVEIGRTIATLGEILDEFDVGTTIRLDRHAGDPVEVYVNGTLFAHGEVVVVQDQLGVKIIELINPAQGARPSGLR